MDKPEKEYSPFPERIPRNVVMGADGRITSDLVCTVHNCTELLRWPDGTEECLLCARDRQPAMKSENPAYFMPPYWEWNPPEERK